MAKYITFGEIMLRLKPPGAERFFQSPQFEATFGGGEANVAVALARFGCDTGYCSVIPANAIGDACVAELRRHGIDTSKVVRKGSRLGIYFLEGGANQRPSVVISVMPLPKPSARDRQGDFLEKATYISAVTTA